MNASKFLSDGFLAWLPKFATPFFWLKTPALHPSSLTPAVRPSVKVICLFSPFIDFFTSLIRFSRSFHPSTYRFSPPDHDFNHRTFFNNRVDSTELRLMLWDTAGQEEFDALTKAYYRGAQGCVLAFSTTDKDSFDAIERWKKKVEYECGNIPMALVQNKIDLIDQAKVTPEAVDKLANRLGLPLFLTSARKNVNIDEGTWFQSMIFSLEISIFTPSGV